MMVACLSPADNNYEETVSTLRYANRAKNIKNKPKINEDPKDAMLREYQTEIEKLKEMLDKAPGGAEFGKHFTSIISVKKIQSSFSAKRRDSRSGKTASEERIRARDEGNEGEVQVRTAIKGKDSGRS